MAIIHCPSCRKRISNKVKVCPHCDIPLGKLTDEEIQQVELRRWRKRVFQASNLSYLSMALLLGGAIWWWGAAPTGFTPPIPEGAIVLVAIGLVGYIVTRGWLFWLKMNRNRPGGTR